MRLRSGSADSNGSMTGSHFLSETTGRVRGRIRRFFNRGSRSPTSPDPTVTETVTAMDGILSMSEEPEDIYTFEDHMELQHFSEASQLLIDRENHLFLRSDESDQLHDWNREVDELRDQRRLLRDAILKTIRLSLNPGEVSLQTLTSAVDAMCKEDEQDGFWMREKKAQTPKWRPSELRKAHDRELRLLVEERMDSPDAPCSSPEAVKGSSIQSDVLSMGRQVIKGLETVVESVRACYPDELDICNFYARLFHNALAARVRKIAEFGLDDIDCTFMLRWVNEYYPEILQKPSLSEHIDSNLDKLLPWFFLGPLAEQYLSRQQYDIQAFISKVLNEAKQSWSDGETPKIEDGCFVSHTAIDIIQVVRGAVKSTKIVLDDLTKAQSLTSFLQELLQSYKSFLNDVIRSNKSNRVPTVKANLHCIQQFIDVLETKSDLFPEEVKSGCLDLLKDVQQSAQSFLLGPVHAELKPLFKKLSSDWLKGAQFEKILESIESKSLDLQGLYPTCHKELMGQLHLDVSVEYVKRLVKADKLRDSNKQQEAHDAVQRDAEELHALLCRLGSQKEWLKDVLIRIAELLKLQDLAAIQMHVASMGTCYPDFSEKHVSAILKLKSNFTKANRQIVKETLQDTLNETTSTSKITFFSLIPV